MRSLSGAYRGLASVLHAMVFLRRRSATVRRDGKTVEIKVEEPWFGWLKDWIRETFGPRGAGAVQLVDIHTANWTDFDQRMRYILLLFRMRQQDAHLFQQPFTDEQRAAIFEGRFPLGPL